MTEQEVGLKATAARAPVGAATRRTIAPTSRRTWWAVSSRRNACVVKMHQRLSRTHNTRNPYPAMFRPTDTKWCSRLVEFLVVDCFRPSLRLSTLTCRPIGSAHLPSVHSHRSRCL
jgi:hypothetical protein